MYYFNFKLAILKSFDVVKNRAWVQGKYHMTQGFLSIAKQ